MAFQFLRTRWAYTRVQTDDTSPIASPSKGRPSLFAILSSKQLRFGVSVVIGICLLIVAVRSRAQITSVGFTTSISQPGASTINNDASSTLPIASPTIRPTAKPSSEPSANHKEVDWSRYAYVQYVTDGHYLCNSVMFFERLQHVQSKADRVMMYPSKMLQDPHTEEGDSEDAKLLLLARDKYDVKLTPVTVQHRQGSDPTWADSFTKLLAFNQTNYDRVLMLDSDSTLLKNVDELFSLPPSPVALPRAYWLFPDQKVLSSQIMLVQPSEAEFSRIESKIDSAGENDYDMELVNQLYMDSAMILPHRPYDLLTGAFCDDSDRHRWYLGNDYEVWDPVAVYNEAKMVHFSDWPMPKPWLDAPENIVREREPKCVMKDGVEDCSARDIWHGFYRDFKERRTRVCNTAPQQVLETNGRRRVQRHKERD